MKGLLADCKHALRLYARTPASSLIAVVVLAIGMAFVGAFLSLYVDLVLRPHPGFEQSGRLVTIGQGDGTALAGLPLALIERIDEEAASLESVVGVFASSIPLGDDESGVVEAVSEGFFDGIKPRLEMGRGFEPSDHQADAEPVAVISHRYWRDELDRDADVLGTTIEVTLSEQETFLLAGRAAAREPDAAEDRTVSLRIVGVMASDMPGIMTDSIAFWIPFEQASRVITFLASNDREQIRASMTLRALGRLAPGASTDAVSRQLNARFAQANDQYELRAGARIEAVRGVVRNISVQRDTSRQLLLFLAASVLLAAVAAANVSLFLLARAPGRRRELGIRMSVGAPLKRLARQLASEAGLLVMVAALLGLLMSISLAGFLRGLAFLQQAEWRNVTLLDWRVLSLVGILLALLTGFVSLAPILGLKRLGIAASSRQVAARATVAQRAAGTLQITVAGALGGVAIAFGAYLGPMIFGDPGYETRDLHLAQYSINLGPVPTFEEYQRVMEAAIVEMSRRREAVEAIPGVTDVAMGQPVPGGGGMSWSMVPDPENPLEQVRVRMGSLDSRFIDLLGLRVAQGRGPAENESNVALVNQAFARTFFGREDVVGERVPIGGPRPGMEIIGVLEDMSFEHPAAEIEPFLFTASTGNSFMRSWIIESTLSSAELRRQLDRASESGGLEVNVFNVRPLSMLRRNLIAADTARSLLTIGTASLVVLLAAFGFYGTQRYLVTAGRREYAIRASLGAGPKALGRLVLRRGVMLSLPGLLLGVMLAYILVTWLRDDYLSREVSPGIVTAAIAIGLAVLLLVASLGPARQAKRTQPAPLLREE